MFFIGPERELPINAESTFDANVCCNKLSPKGSDIFKNVSDVIATEPVRAAKMGILEMSPNDEVEGEILYFQSRLLRNADVKKQFSGL